MKRHIVTLVMFCLLMLLMSPLLFAEEGAYVPYPIVDTGQEKTYNNTISITAPGAGQSFYGQDVQYAGRQPSYTNNGDGTVTDNVTGLMWQKTPGDKVTWNAAVAGASSLRVAGHSDWRLPSIKELYSLMDFSGRTGMSATDSVPYLDTDYFDFEYGDTSAGERFIDAQYWSATEYVSTTMSGDPTVFGVNFADGRIKGYPKTMGAADKLMFVRYVRGNTDYGKNNFADNGDGTVTDHATGLMWMKKDSGALGAGSGSDGSLNWEEALDWAESLDHAGYSDWRLPNAKELQSIVDYTRSPATTNSPAIAPVFETTSILDGNGNTNYPFFWTGTTHVEGSETSGSQGAYVAFGEAQGYMEVPTGSGNYQLWDVHGAGAQRSDPKSGDPAAFPYGRGPQGDVIRIYNFVRCVRTASNIDPDPDDDDQNDDDGDSDDPSGDEAFGFQKLNIKLNFAVEGKDQMKLIGTLPVPEGFEAEGQQVSVSVGGVERAFLLDEKGRSPRGETAVCRISLKRRQGITVASDTKFLMRLTKENISSLLTDEGLTNETTDRAGIQVRVPITINFNGSAYEATAVLTYRAREGKRGIAK